MGTIANRYSVNDTMRLIGYQPIKYAKNEKGFDDVLDAHSSGGYTSFDLALDMFNLGVVVGKRQERARRKAARSRMYQNEETAVAILFELLDTPREDIPQIRQKLLETFQDKPALTRFVQTAFSLIER